MATPNITPLRASRRRLTSLAAVTVIAPTVGLTLANSGTLLLFFRVTSGETPPATVTISNGSETIETVTVVSDTEWTVLGAIPQAENDPFGMLTLTSDMNVDCVAVEIPEVR
jgi:hypothetical protein